MRQFRQKKNRFFLRHRDMGIPHLLLGIAAIRVLILFVSMADRSGALINAIAFLPQRILNGEIWRAITFIFLPDTSPWFVLFEILFYYFMDRALEGRMGRLKLNLFVLTTVLLINLVSLVSYAIYPNVINSIYYSGYAGLVLDFSLFFALAATIPDMQLLVMFILPVKVKFLAWIDLGLIVYYAIGTPFPVWLVLLVPVAMLCLFFWKDIPDLLPAGFFTASSRAKYKRERKKAQQTQNKPPIIHEVKPYRHKCKVCGRTDVSDPELEFRYCSRCSGYFCYCSDHINNHIHVIDADVETR